MPVTMKIAVPGGEMQIQGTDQKDIFRQAAFWQSLPTTCPIDGSPTRLEFRSPQDYEYYMVVNTGPFPYEYKLGIHNNAEKTLFNKGKWTYYDNDRKEEVVVWEYGNVIEKNLPKEGARTRPSPSTTSAPGPDDDVRRDTDEVFGDDPKAAKRKALTEQGRKYVTAKLNEASVPDSMRGAVLTAMLHRPIQNDLRLLTLQDAREFKEYLDNIPDGVTHAWEDVKAEDPAAAAGDGSDLDFPDFLDDD